MNRVLNNNKIFRMINMSQPNHVPEEHDEELVELDDVANNVHEDDIDDDMMIVTDIDDDDDMANP